MEHLPVRRYLWIERCAFTSTGAQNRSRAREDVTPSKLNIGPLRNGRPRKHHFKWDAEFAAWTGPMANIQPLKIGALAVSLAQHGFDDLLRNR